MYLGKLSEDEKYGSKIDSNQNMQTIEKEKSNECKSI